MSKRLILKLIKQLFKQYAYVKDITYKNDEIIIKLKPYDTMGYTESIGG